MRLKTAISNQVFSGWEIGRAMDYVARLGYNGMELAPHDLAETVFKITPSRRREIRQAAARAGIEIVGFHSALKCDVLELHIQHPDAAVRQRTVDYTRALIELAGDLGAKILVMGSPKQRGIFPGLTAQQAWDLAKDSFCQVLDSAVAHSVTLCMEAITHRLTNFVSTVDEALRMVQEVNHPAFQTMIDVRSACDDVAPIPELVHRAAPHLRHFHANDSNGKGPGMGLADYPGIAAALSQVGYSGYLSVEVFDFADGAEKIATESMQNLRKYFG